MKIGEILRDLARRELEPEDVYRERPTPFPTADALRRPPTYPNVPMASDAENARIESRQMPIFPRDSHAVCMELELAWRDARRLHDDGLLSFDPETGGALDEAREAELVFLGAIVSAGCSRPVLRQLLAGLRKPYCYDVRRVFYAWSTQEWRLLPGEDDPEGAFFALLDRLRERQAYEALLNLRGWLDEALDLARDRTQMFAHMSGGGLGGARSSN